MRLWLVMLYCRSWTSPCFPSVKPSLIFAGKGLENCTKLKQHDSVSVFRVYLPENDESVNSVIGLRRDGFCRGIDCAAVAGKCGVSFAAPVSCISLENIRDGIIDVLYCRLSKPACDGFPQPDFRLVSVGAEAGGRERAYADRRRGHGREFPAGDVVAALSSVNVFHLFSPVGGLLRRDASFFGPNRIA